MASHVPNLNVLWFSVQLICGLNLTAFNLLLFNRNSQVAFFCSRSVKIWQGLKRQNNKKTCHSRHNLFGKLILTLMFK